MANGDTDINICSRALIAIGANEITSFEEGTVEAKVAKAKFEIAKRDLLSIYPWTFSITETFLARIASDDLAIYKYIYELPDDFLRALTLRGDYQNIPYTLRSGKINTDDEKPILVYTADCSIQSMPAYFVSLLIDRLARDFLIPITAKNDDYPMFDRIYQQNLTIAKNADAQSKTPRVVNTDLLLRVR